MGLIFVKQFNAYIESDSTVIPNPQGYEFETKAILSEFLGNVVNYDNYRESKFDDFWESLLNKKETNGDLYPNALKTLLNEDNSKDLFQSKILECYNEQKQDSLVNEYYYYITFINILKKLDPSFNENDNEEFLSLFITETLDLNDSLREPVFSVNDIIDFSITSNGEKVSYLFKYHEIEFKQKDINKNIYKIQINAPVGTVFLLNHQPELFFINDYQNKNNLYLLEGVFEMDTEGLIPIEYITFPQQAAPGVIPDETDSLYTKETIKNIKITISLFYTDD